MGHGGRMDPTILRADNITIFRYSHGYTCPRKLLGRGELSDTIQGL